MSKRLIEWQSHYNLGLDEIDEQHRSLVELINKIWNSIVGKSDQETVLLLVEELEKYTLAHFAAEETFMRVTDYPEFGKHKVEHHDFIQKVALAKKTAIRTGAFTLDTMYFLRDWLVDHILVSDKHYAKFSLQKNESKSGLLSRLFKRLF